MATVCRYESSRLHKNIYRLHRKPDIVLLIFFDELENF
ncbi:MAG: hypothetical protein FD137_833, partial [Spirochaetes bacterium]